MSAYRGFFQGQHQMMPTALSQIAEQLGRVFVALLLVVVLLPRGLEHAAAGASFGAAAGALAGLLILLFIWGRQRPCFLGLSAAQHRTRKQGAFHLQSSIRYSHCLSPLQWEAWLCL
jgi:stage V sporulation protein B